MSPGVATGLRRELANIVGDEYVLASNESTAPFQVDFTERFRGRASLVVQPGSSAEVSGVLKACADASIPVVPQGGRTGLVGGSTPLDGEIVLSLSRLTTIGSVDPGARQVSAGAGCTLAQLLAETRRHHLQFPIAHGALEQASVGGTVATNAGGIRAMRYGVTRQHVAGVEAVLSDGSIISRMSGLLKDTAGYDIAQLLCGSEGTLGVITEARLKLVPIPAAHTTVAVALDRLQEALRLLALLRSTDSTLEAAEFFGPTETRLVANAFGWSFPLSEGNVYLLLEWAHERAEDGLSDEAAEVIDRERRNVVAVEAKQRDQLWRIRQALPVAVATRGIPRKYDVALPLHQLDAFDAELDVAARSLSPGIEFYRWGHLGDGNVHVNVVGSGVDDRIDELVLSLVVSLGGSISAEHGVGRAKAQWLGLMRAPSELQLLARIKHAFDPKCLLNPGVMLKDAA